MSGSFTTRTPETCRSKHRSVRTDSSVFESEVDDATEVDGGLACDVGAGAFEFTGELTAAFGDLLALEEVLLKAGSPVGYEHAVGGSGDGVFIDAD